jgi:hypothetical protein
MIFTKSVFAPFVSYSGLLTAWFSLSFLHETPGR